MLKIKIGDVVKNHHTTNCCQYGIVVEKFVRSGRMNPGHFIKVILPNNKFISGDYWEYKNNYNNETKQLDKIYNFDVIGHIDIKKYLTDEFNKIVEKVESGE